MLFLSKKFFFSFRQWLAKRIIFWERWRVDAVTDGMHDLWKKKRRKKIILQLFNVYPQCIDLSYCFIIHLTTNIYLVLFHPSALIHYLFHQLMQVLHFSLYMMKSVVSSIALSSLLIIIEMIDCMRSASTRYVPFMIGADVGFWLGYDKKFIESDLNK